MQINSIPTTAPLLAVKSSTAPTNSTQSTSATSPPKAGGESGSGQPSAPPQSVASAVSTATSTLSSSTYSTSAGGKTYSANISQANGTYTLSVANLPGASVSGSSLDAAESALSVKIDTMA